MTLFSAPVPITAPLTNKHPYSIKQPYYVFLASLCECSLYICYFYSFCCCTIWINIKTLFCTFCCFSKKGNERLVPTKRPTLRYHEQRNSSGAKSNHYGTLNGKLIACLTKVIMFPLAYIKQLLHLLSAETAGFAPTFFAALRSLDTKPKVE